MSNIPDQYRLNDFWTKKVSLVLLVLGAVAFLLSFLQAINFGVEEKAVSSSFVSSFFVAASESAGHGSPFSRFFHSYLAVYVFFMAIVFGSIFFVILQSLTRAGWSVLVRRIPEVYSKNVVLMAILALPLVVFGMHDLYHWTDKAAVEHDVLLQAKEAYLNIPFFYIRIVFYFVALFFIVKIYSDLSQKQDSDGDVAHTLKMQKYAPVAMLAFALIITFFSFDFLMSLMPHWYSTIWGVYYFASSTVVSLSLFILSFLFLRRLGYLKKEVTVEHYHDLGKLLFAFNVFWSYIAFSQYMLIWYANIPETTIFYLNRINGQWLSVSIALLVGHIFIPILFYVSRNVKRSFFGQLAICLILFFVELLNMFWIVLPNIDTSGFHVTFSDTLLILGMAGLFFGLFLRNLGKVSLVPLKDPRFEESLNFENS